MPDQTYGRWQYGDAGDRIPVKVGDVWKAGDHILACGDLERGAGDELITRFGPIHATYSDPPWNAGNARAFRTKAAVGKEVDFSALLKRIIGLAKTSGEDAFIEMGEATEDLLRELLVNAGALVIKSYPILYYKKHPCRLVHATWNTGKAIGPLNPDPSGLDDDDIPPVVIPQVIEPGKTVFDPCTGLGATARGAHLTGRRFLGLELHPRRLAVTLDWLREQGATPERVDVLNSMQ